MASERHFLENKTIIVAGGGVAGSAFAAGLRRLWPPDLKPPTITIYDRDAEDVAAQREGYSLSLVGYDPAGGLMALRNLGLLDEVLATAVSGSDGAGCFKIWGPDWKEHVRFRHRPAGDLPASSIRVARKELRRILHQAVGSEHKIQWRARCMSARRLENGRVRVEVVRDGDGAETVTEEDCDILIAADGASSKLRTCLRPDDTLDFAGAILRGGLSRFPNELPEPLSQDWGFMLSGTGVSCFFSPVDRHSLVWGVGHLEKEKVPPLDLGSTDDVQAVLDRALRLGSKLQEPFKTVVKQTDPKTVMCLNARDKKPFAHDDIDQMSVVFIGDSNHAVSPFAGYGANLALIDGWDLAEQLCKGKSLREAVSAYDGLAVPRAGRVLKRSRARLRDGHRTGVRFWVFWYMLTVWKFVGWMLGRKVT